MRSDSAAKSLFMAVMLLAGPAQAVIDEIFKLSIGTTVSRFDSSITFTSKDGSIGTGIDLEDDFGYDSEVNSGWISGWYRFGDRHRLAVVLVPTRRSSFLATKKDFDVGDDTIKAGASLSSTTDVDIWDISYIYSVYKKPNLEIGLSAGVYWLRTDTRLLATGEVLLNNETTPEFRADYQTRQKISAPLPLFGIMAEYEIMHSWRVRAGARYFAITVSEIDGSVFAANVGTDYYFTESLGVGLALSRANVDVDATSIIFEGAIDWSYNSAQLYLIYKY